MRMPLQQHLLELHQVPAAQVPLQALTPPLAGSPQWLWVWQACWWRALVLQPPPPAQLALQAS
jgi:hypothetical protein